jgi:hypothetical protein
MRQARSLRLAQIALAGAVIGVMLLVSACGGDSHLQQLNNQARSRLDKQIEYAKSLGVTDSQLQPIIQQEQKLNNSSAPFAWFDDAPDNTYYKNQTTSYQQLLTKLQTLLSIVTGQDQGQAQQDLQRFQQALTAQQAQKVGNLQAFSLRYTADQNLLAAAQYPKDYLAIGADAVNATTTLGLMSTTYGKLVIFEDTITQMQQAHLDVTVMQTEYNDDLSVFSQDTTIDEFHKLGTLIDAQYQESVVGSIQSLPYVGAAKLREFQDQIDLLKTYGVDASPYQKLYDVDKANIAKAKTPGDYMAVSAQIDADIASMQPDLTQGASWYLIKKLDREANAWGQAHLFHDKYDGQDYIPDSGYTMNGIGFWLQRENGWSYTTEDYQSVINDDNSSFYLFSLFQQDYADTTPYNKVHQTDLELMQHYPSLKYGTAIIVSMAQESLHFFVDGKLVNTFLVTTGRWERPTLPGVWLTQNREAPTQFKSSDPPGSPYWYPPTDIHYAILYHWGGFFVHDAWWRYNYGPGTQYPHQDDSGLVNASNGSHGCVNVQEDQMAWLYGHTDWSTQIVIY